jgi:uncharacterized repeat protein (TIGR03803 family)
MRSSHAAVRAAIGTCLLASAAFAAQAGPFKDLHDFTANPDGREPAGGLVLAGSLLYGTTNVGGTSDAGCIYSIDPATGQESVLYSFTGAFGGQGDGSAPVGELIVVDGLLYGATSFGGQFNGGTIFSFDPGSATENVLYSFGSGADGLMPGAGLVAVDGTLYGTTTQGGSASLGTAFAFDLASSQETVLHDFAGGSDGAGPSAPLAAGGGLLYGTTFFGGASDDGTVFKLDPATGNTAVLHAFNGSSFSGNPAAGVILQGGMLYGTTSRGGRPRCGGGCGTVFQVNASSGKEKNLYRFSGRADGSDPEGGLVLDHGVLHGTTMSGGKGGSGTLFSVDIATGAKTTLHNFKFPTGANPGTIVELGGAFYGTTHGGGAAAEGTVFKFKP